MAAECAGVDYTYVSVNPTTGETKTPEFLAMNPTHTIPTIKDGRNLFNRCYDLCVPHYWAVTP